MATERNIGRIVSVDSFSVYVRLDEDLKSLYKSGYEEIYPVARINSYVVIPVGAERIVALVNRVMTREETDLTNSSSTIFLTESNRYLSATMVGTIENGRYIQGVYNYPVLDNPVWYVTREDLDIIFDQHSPEGAVDFLHDFYLPIGTSPAFPDYQVKINPDKLFAKHAAILGNTGSGKSCTLSSVLQSLFRYQYNGQQLKNSHIIIFDTNGEYKEAFNLDAKYKINPFWINEEGLRIPYWFMNYDDMDYLFEPTSGTQGPILKRALGLAKSKVVAQEHCVIPRFHLNKLQNFVNALIVQNGQSNYVMFRETAYVYKLFQDLNDKSNNGYDLSVICDSLKIISDLNKDLKMQDRFLVGCPDLVKLNAALSAIESELNTYRCSLSNGVTSENRNIDIPLYYDFTELMSSCFDMAIREASTSQDKLNEYVSTLKLRMQSFVDDVRLAEPLLLDKMQDIEKSLVQFLAYLLGDYCEVFDGNDKSSIFAKYYGGSGVDDCHSQITIIDMSLLPYQVLETITGLIGRIILEFLSRFKKEQRGNMPVVMVLEEAQNYIPEIGRKDRESISKKIFERIAREGRKYGLSLVISSQRPSELSKTVLSQCNSFIIHRIQNPDDQIYIRKLVSSANAEILSQLPTLPQQHAIVMGECVRTPVVVKVNTAKPTPNSNNPEFIGKWLKDDKVDYDEIVNRWTDQ